METTVNATQAASSTTASSEASAEASTQANQPSAEDQAAFEQAVLETFGVKLIVEGAVQMREALDDSE